LVRFHHAGLDGAGAPHGLDQGGLVAGQQPVDVLLQEGEEIAVQNRAVLDDLAQPAQVLPLRQGVQGGDVDQDRARLVEGADQVFSLGMVDAGLSTYAGVDLGQKRGGNLDEGDAAQVTGGGKAGHVADHAAAQRHDEGAAVQGGVDQRVVDQVQGGGVLEGLAVRKRHREHTVAGRRQRGAYPFVIEGGYGGVGDNG